MVTVAGYYITGCCCRVYNSGYCCRVYITVVTAAGYIFIVQELCESRGGRPGLSILMSLLVSVDVKLY